MIDYSERYDQRQHKESKERPILSAVLNALMALVFVPLAWAFVVLFFAVLGEI